MYTASRVRVDNVEAGTEELGNHKDLLALIFRYFPPDVIYRLDVRPVSSEIFIFDNEYVYMFKRESDKS
jgi:hypothetical protein